MLRATWRRRTFGILTVLAAWLLQAGPAFSCSCPWSPFSKVASQGDLVVLGRVVSHHENSMQVKISQVIHGKEERPQITVWGDNGMQCRPYVSRFPVGTIWIFSLHDLADRYAEEDLKGLAKPLPIATAGSPYYGISGCGAHWLEVRGDDAYGKINEEEPYSGIEESIPVHEVVRWFEEGAQGKLSPLSHPRKE